MRDKVAHLPPLGATASEAGADEYLLKGWPLGYPGDHRCNCILRWRGAIRWGSEGNTPLHHET